MVNRFSESVDAIFEDVSLTYQLIDAKFLIDCSKNYSNLTRAKIVPIMADPISLNENVP